MMNNKKELKTIFIIFLLVMSVIPLINIIPTVRATGISLKWTCNWGYASYADFVTKDVNGDGIDEVFIAGYNATLGNSALCCINGLTGSIIWEKTITTLNSYHIGATIADLDNDGNYEIVIPCGSHTRAYNCEDGSTFWDVAVPSGWGTPVVVDVDGNGYPYVYTASNSEYPPDKLYKLYGVNGTIAASVACFYVCYGGISAADINNDGEVEIVVGDANYTKCYDKNLKLLWQVNPPRDESMRPVLINVTGDSKLEVVMLRLDETGHGGCCVLYCNGTIVPGMNTADLGFYAHTQPTVWRDLDGHVKLLVCSDSYPKLFDINDWTIDYTFPEKGSEPPDYTKVEPGSAYQILTPYAHVDDDSEVYNGSTYALIEKITNTWGINTLIQDLDGDGYNELLVNGVSNGPLKCFDTLAPAAAKRLRTETQHYGERAQKAAVYCPYPNSFAYTQQSPSNNQKSVPINTASWKTYIKDYNGITFHYTIQTVPNIGSSSGNGATSGIKSVTLSGLSVSTTYTVYVNSTDAYGFLHRIYKFTTTSQWWNDSFQYRKLITFNASQIEGTLTNFPVLINITDTDLKNHAQSDGDDICFVKYSDNSTKLNHEIERYTSTTGALLVWLNMTTLSSTNNKVWMYYGNPQCTNQQNKYGTWNSDYLAVYHMNGATNYKNITDSTRNHRNATSSVSDPAYQQPGRIGYAVDFDATDDSIQTSRIFTNNYASFTIEAWTFPKASTARYIWCQQNITTGKGAILESDGSGKFHALINGSQVTTSIAFTANKWYYVVWTKQLSPDQNYLYVNKTRGANTAGQGTPGWTTANKSYIANRYGNDRDYNGLIDELRLSKTCRSRAWLNTSYNNIVSSFTSKGTEEVIYDTITVTNPFPGNNAINVTKPPAYFKITVADSFGYPMRITWQENNSGTWKTFNISTNKASGTYTVINTSWVNKYHHKFYWRVLVNDNYGKWSNNTYRFTTGNWWNTNWHYRKEITIDHTKVTSDLTNFSVLIKIIDSNLSLKAQADGNDIVFANKTGIKLNHEIEHYNSATGELVAWVKVPVLSSSQNTIIYLYYGNQNCGNQQNITNTWDVNFLAVHHMDETAGTLFDSTSHHNNGTPYGNPNQNVTGKIDGADSFDGINDHFILPPVYSTQSKFTLEAWIYPQTGTRYFISQWSYSHGVFLQVGYHPDHIEWYMNGNSGGIAGITLNTWYHIVLTYDGTTARIYRNAGTPTSRVCAAPTWPTQGVYIGDRSAGSRQFHGIIDEVRLSNIARSFAWISTEYTNQNNPSGFYSVGNEENTT